MKQETMMRENTTAMKKIIKKIMHNKNWVEVVTSFLRDFTQILVIFTLCE